MQVHVSWLNSIMMMSQVSFPRGVSGLSFELTSLNFIRINECNWFLKGIKANNEKSPKCLLTY